MSRSTSSVLRTVSIAVCIVLSTVMAHAQYRASIQGVVTDAQGAVVPGATLTLTDKDNNHRLTAATNDGGIYNFSALPPDHYSLTVEKTGFKKKVLDNLGVIAEQANAINVELEVGAGNETVTVSGTEVPLIDTETAQVSGTVTSQEIQKLPSFGRDVFQLLQLAPGVFGDGAQQQGGGTNSLPGSNNSGSGATSGPFQTENQPQVVANGSPAECQQHHA